MARRWILKKRENIRAEINTNMCMFSRTSLCYFSLWGFHVCSDIFKKERYKGIEKKWEKNLEKGEKYDGNK